MLSDSRSPADLAAIAARAAGSRASATRFEVVHRATHSEAALPLTMSELAHSNAEAQETLGFDIPGAGFEIRTWSTMAELPRAGVEIADAPGRPGGTDERVRVVTGVAVLNPSFVYNTGNATAVLLTLRHGDWAMDFGDCLMLTEALEMLSSAAAERGLAPIVFLQSPVAPFRDPGRRFRQDGSGEQPRVSRGLAVRMAVAADESRPDSRIELLRFVTARAAALGFGVQIADHRLGRVRGDWWTVLAADEEAYQRHKAAAFGFAPKGPISRVQMLTFAGPARTGSTVAILRDLQARHVGVVAVSVSALQEVAFLNLVVPIAPPKVTAALADRTDSVESGLGHLGSVAGLTRARGAGRRTGDLKAARDYQVIQTGPVEYRADDELPHRPLWVAWVIPAGPHPSIPEVVREILLESPYCTGVTLDYFRSKVLPSGQIRGRAKVAVTLKTGNSEDGVPEILSDLCDHVQTIGKRTLADHLPDAAEVVRLRVVWRERWLGRWQSVV